MSTQMSFLLYKLSDSRLTNKPKDEFGFFFDKVKDTNIGTVKSLILFNEGFCDSAYYKVFIAAYLKIFIYVKDWSVM